MMPQFIDAAPYILMTLARQLIYPLTCPYFSNVKKLTGIIKYSQNKTGMISSLLYIQDTGQRDGILKLNVSHLHCSAGHSRNISVLRTDYIRPHSRVYRTRLFHAHSYNAHSYSQIKYIFISLRLCTHAIILLIQVYNFRLF